MVPLGLLLLTYFAGRALRAAVPVNPSRPCSTPAWPCSRSRGRAEGLAALCFAAALVVSLSTYAVLGRFRATHFLIGG